MSNDYSYKPPTFEQIRKDIIDQLPRRWNRQWWRFWGPDRTGEVMDLYINVFAENIVLSHEQLCEDFKICKVCFEPIHGPARTFKCEIKHFWARMETEIL